MPSNDRPMGSLVAELMDEVRRLMRAEVTRTRLELKAEGRKAAVGAGFAYAGWTVAGLGATAIVACCILALATAMPAWAAALAVGMACVGLGAGIAFVGVRQLRTVNPQHTVEHLKEDGQWASETMQSLKRERRAHA